MVYRVICTLVAGVLVILSWGAAPSHAAFPGKNGKIAFTRGGAAIWVMDADGANAVELARFSPFFNRFPRWSADGEQITFESSGGIGVMNADGSARRRHSSPDQLFFDPSWSPDGSKIVFAGLPLGTGSMDIYVMNADGTDRTRLTGDPARDAGPVWSPDGTRIAFTSEQPDGWHLSTMRPDGTDLQHLTDAFIFDAEADWSPSGKEIVFMSLTGALHVIEGTGHNERKLPDPSGIFRSTPAWSPDGTKILFWRFAPPAGEAQIFVMNADGSDPRRVIESTASDSSPDWRPIPGPRRSDYKNAADFCKAEREFWGEDFAGRYGGGANAFGRCVSQSKG